MSQTDWNRYFDRLSALNAIDTYRAAPIAANWMPMVSACERADICRKTMWSLILDHN